MNNSPSHDAVVTALRNYGANHLQLTRGFANSLNLHPTDARALAEVIYSQDAGNTITPSQLANRVALSKSALSACLNRLEALELITRENHPTDRRVTFIHYNPKIYQYAEAFFQQISSKMDTVIDKYSEEEIKRFCQFLEEASQAIQVKN